MRTMTSLATAHAGSPASFTRPGTVTKWAGAGSAATAPEAREHRKRARAAGMAAAGRSEGGRLTTSADGTIEYRTCGRRTHARGGPARGRCAFHKKKLTNFHSERS